MASDENTTYRPNLRLRVNENGSVSMKDAFAEKMERERQEREQKKAEEEAFRKGRAQQQAERREEEMVPEVGPSPLRWENGNVVQEKGNNNLYAVPGQSRGKAVERDNMSPREDLEKREPETPKQAAEMAMTGRETSESGIEDVKEAGETMRDKTLAEKTSERILQKMQGAADKWSREHPWRPGPMEGEMAGLSPSLAEHNEGYYAHLTPEAANQYIQEVLHDTDFIPEIVDRAKQAGMSEVDYVRERLVPQIQQQVYDKLVEERAPKSTLEYVLSGAMNSLIGQVYEASMLPREERTLRQAGRAAAGERAGGLARLGNMATGLAADLPVFSVLGGANQFLTRGMAAAAVRNNTMAAATQVAREMLTFGEYDALSSAVGQWFREDDVDWRKVAAASGKGLLSGTAMGMWGVGTNMLSRSYIARNGFGPTRSYTLRGKERELRGVDVSRWAANMAGKSAVLSMSSVLGQRMENPDFRWEDVNWGDEMKHALLLNLMLDVQGRVMHAGKQDGFEGGKLTPEDVSDLQRAGVPVKTERQAYDYVVQTGRMGVLNDRRLSMTQKQKLVDLLGLREKDGQALVLQSNPSVRVRLGRTIDERWAVDEYDTMGTLNDRRTFETKEAAEAYGAEIEGRVEQNRMTAMEGTAEARRQTMGNVESIRAVSEQYGVPAQAVAIAVGKEMRGEAMTAEEKALSDEVKAYVETYLRNVPTLSEETAMEVEERHQKEEGWIEHIQQKAAEERTGEEREALKEYTDELEALLYGKEANQEKTENGATEAGRRLYESGDTEAQRKQVVRAQVARERLERVAGKDFVANLDAKGEAALYDYVYVPDEYMPLVEDYLKQKETVAGMDARMEDAMRPAMETARGIVGEMSPTTDAEGRSEVQLVRDGSQQYVVRRQVGDVLMVTPIGTDGNGMADWSTYDGEVTRVMKWSPRLQFETRPGEDVVREMVPEYTAERERIHGAATEEEVLAVEAEGRTSPNPSKGGERNYHEAQNDRIAADGRREDMIGRSLSEEEADDLILESTGRAEAMPEVELTPENWAREFGDGHVATPLGEVKMGENQYQKLIEKGRQSEFGMIKPTLTNPDFIIEEGSTANDGQTERASSYLFVKSFIGRDGRKRYFFKSVTVKKDGLEVNVSSYLDRAGRVRESLEKGKLLWKRSELASDSSDVNQGLYKQPGMESEPAVQGRVHPQSDLSEGKVTENVRNAQGNEGKNGADGADGRREEQWTEDGRVSDGHGGSVWAEPGETVEKLTEDMGGDRTAALRVVRNKSKQLRRDLEESDRRLDEITDAKEYKAEWDRNLMLRERIEYWQAVDNAITDIQREAELPEASRKMRVLMKQMADALGVKLDVTDDMRGAMQRYSRVRVTEADAGRTNGFQTTEGGIVVNSRTVRGLSWAFGHETGHEMKDRDPEAYQRWKETILGTMDAEALEREMKSKRENATYKGKTDEELLDEIANDQIGEIMADPKKLETFVRQLNPHTLKHFWDTTKKWLQNVDGVTFDDVLESAQKAGGKVLDDIRERIDVWRGFKEELTETERLLAEAYKQFAEEIRPIGTGAFGDIYDQFVGKPKEAIEFLKTKKSGEAIGALNHKDIGDIDLVWGEEGTGKSDGYGLAKLVKYHPDVLDNLQGILNDMHITAQTDNRIQMESDTHQASVRLTWDNQKKTWLLTAFEKKNSVLGNTTDTDETSARGKQNGTATLQNTVSKGKGTEIISDVQGKRQENSERANLSAQGEIQGLEGISEKEVLDAVRADVERVLEENGVSGVTIKGMALNGSRMRGDAREDSDLDVVMEVEGNVREDDLFNMLSDADLSYEGIKVDVNPIMRGKSGTLEEYMKRSRAYDDEMRFSAEIELHDKKTGDDDLAFGKKFVSLHTERDREAVRGQRERFAPTAPWREGVDDVTVHTTLGTMRKKYGELHERAKAGDEEAALKLVAAVVKPEKVKALAKAHPDARVVCVHAEEATGRNQIPGEYAKVFQKEGLSLSNIVQINKPAHTGSDRVGRFFRRARFDGEVEQGMEYILVDDHVTMGGTLRDLKDYIESKGGKVVAVSTLTASAGSTKLRPTEEQIRRLNEKGITNEQLERAGIADGFDGLTRSEAREILVLADAGGDRGTPRRLATDNRPLNENEGKPAREILVLADAEGNRGPSQRREGSRTRPQVLEGVLRTEDGVSDEKHSQRIAPEEGEHFLDYAQRVAHIRRLAVDTNPSEAQKEAGNYKKGHLRLDGYNITIENPRGTTRSGKDASGKEWSVRMNYDYGYIRGTEGVDGDHIDVYLSEKPEEGNVYVVDQIDQRTGKFDEHKVMYGFPTEEAARKAYLSQYEEGWKMGPVTEVSREQFKKWIESSHRKTKPFSEYKSLALEKGDGANGSDGGVRFSAEDKERVFEAAKKHFGVTRDLREAGYILPDGTMLDFSGRHELDPGMDSSFLSGGRTNDHRDIKQLNYDRDGKETGLDVHMADFIERGAIRIDVNSGIINLSGKPTAEQRAMLQRLIQRNDGDVSVDFGNGDNSDHYVEYEGVRAQRVFSDIAKYFDEGVRPEGNMRFSAEDAGRMGTWEYMKKGGLTRENTPIFMYALAGRYLRRLPRTENGYGRRSLGRFGDHVDVRKAGEEREVVAPVLREWRDELLAVIKSDKATEPSRARLKSEVYELEYALNWYDRVAQGDDEFYVTMERPRFSAESDSRSAEDIARRDKEYAEAVAAGDKEKVDAMLREEAAAKGYDASSDYQGSLAFNGAAPSRNGYFETREDRKKAFDEGDFEGEYSLGDFAKVGLDNNDLGWQLSHPAAASAGHRPTLESIRNLNNAIKSKDRKIRMYRAVDVKVKEDSFRNGDWVTPSREYAENHIQLQDWEKGRIIEQDVSIDDIWWNGDDINEWGYDDGKGYVYKNTENNRKLLEATYDDKGELIPLSKRFDASKADIRFSAESPTFYSNAQRAVEGIRQEKATPEQWLKMIEKAGGLKAGEDKWMGLSEWLKQPHPQPLSGERGAKPRTLTKQEVMDYIRENSIQVEETSYAETDEQQEFAQYRKEFKEYYNEAVADGAEDPQDVAWQRMIEEYGEDFSTGFYAVGGELLWDNDYLNYESEMNGMPRTINKTRLGYTSEGLTNKREVALTVPTIEPWNESDEIHFGDAGKGRAVAWVRFGETRDKDGNRVLVIDEIQSKRHQEGREKGYKTAEAVAEEERLVEAVGKAQEAYDEYTRRMGEKYDGAYEDIYADMNLGERVEADRLQQEVIAADERYQNHKVPDVPDAPFEKNWHELAMKRMLRLAAEEGFDKVAWTTGMQQAARYDIGKVIDQVERAWMNQNTGETRFDLQPKDNSGGISLFVKDGMVTRSAREEFEGKPLADVVGKELAQKMLEMEDYSSLNIADLNLGGEGMRGFYDQMLPRFMDKYGKKWGVKTYDQEYQLADDGHVENGKMVFTTNYTWHTVDVTPEMRQSVMEGQPMFSAEAETEYRRLSDIVEKPYRIEKLRNSKPVEITYTNEYPLERKSAKKWLKENIKGEYVNEDTGVKIGVSNYGIDKVTSHGEREDAHLKSLAAIPDMIRQSIYIGEAGNEKDNNKYESYQYYVCGLKIDGDDYTAKIVVGVKNGERYYDHELTQIEKGSLIDSLNEIAKPVAEKSEPVSGFTTAGDAPLPPYSAGKDKRLFSILQTNPQEIADARAKMRKMEAKMAEREDVNYSAEDEEFNRLIDTLDEKNKDSVVLSLGKPSKVLLDAGVENKPMKLYGNKVINKQKKHGFKLDELHNLPSAVADPIAVFNNYKKEGNRSILTELHTEQGKFLVAVTIGDGIDVDFNIISSVFGKGKEKLEEWLRSGKATYVNEKKTLDFLYYPAPIAETPKNQEPISDAKVNEIGELNKLLGEKLYIRTKNFKEYFGDWENEPEHASKIVNENGEPLVVYHGTNRSFTAFDIEKAGMTTNNKGIFGNGFYLTNMRRLADDYRGPRRPNYTEGEGGVMELYANIRNPFYWNSKEGYEEAKKLGFPKSRMRDGKLLPLVDEEETLRFTQALKDAGYDGVVYEYSQRMDGKKVKEIVAFEPTQIKSATENIGTYDSQNPDIRFSSEAIDQYVKSLHLEGDSKEAKENIRHGLVSLRKIASGADYVENAMKRKVLLDYADTDEIMFEYGKPGEPDKNYKGGYGISHIASKHGEDTLLKVLNVLATGDIGRYVDGNKTVVFTDGDYEAVVALTKFGKSKNWLLSGWEKIEKADGNGEVSTQSTPTQGSPTFSRTTLGAAISDANLRRLFGFPKENGENIQFSSEGHSEEWKDAERELAGHPEALRHLRDVRARSIEEVAAGVLSEGGLLWGDAGDGALRKKGVKSMMGWSEGERRRFLRMFSSEENGGMSMAEAGERVEQVCREEGIPYDAEDAMAGVNALQQVLGSADGMADLTRYVERQRIDEAREMVEEELRREGDARDVWYRARYGMSYEEYQESLRGDENGQAENVRQTEMIDWLQKRNQRQTERLAQLESKLEELKKAELARPLVVAQGRMLAEQQAQIGEAKSEVNRLKDELRYRKAYDKAYRELLEVKRELSAFVRERMAADDMPFTSKRELNKLLSTIEHTNTLEQMADALTEVKTVASRSRLRHLRHRLERLMSMKVQGVNGRNMSVAKTVDERTRRIIEDIRGRVADIGLTGLEDELDALRRERRQTRGAINDAQKTGKTEEAETLEAHWRELTEQIEAKEGEIAERQQQKHGKGKIDVGQEISDLTERFDRAAAGEKGVTWSEADADRLSALYAVQIIEESKDHSIDANNIERNIADQWKRTAELREKLKDTSLSEDERRAIREEMGTLKRDISAGRGLLAEAIETEAQSVGRSVEMMESLMDEGRNSLKRRVDEQLIHRMEILKGAFGDIRVPGKEPNYDLGERTLKETPGIKLPLSCNIGSFEYMAKRISQSGVSGEDGWIYQHFVKGDEGVMAAYNTYRKELTQQKEQLNAKVTELFGTENNRWFNTDAWTRQAAKADKVEMRSGVSILVEPESYERMELPLSKGAATYLYMVWKMDDGQMKMRRQGFDEQSMQEIEDYIGPKYKALADWLQDEFLTESRARYNERYVEMYNTSMARIKNYVPLRVNKDATQQESSLSDDRERRQTLEQRAGSLINRRVNLLPVDITKSVFDVISEHVESMEKWYAYAPVRRDLDAILSSTYFRNQLDLNNAGHYKRFYDAAAVATQSYMPPAAEHGDKFMALMTRGLLSGNIAWRFATAIKQLYSATAYLGYTYDPKFAGYLAKNLGTSLLGRNIKWCIQNIPSFAERADVGDVGNYRLREKIGTVRTKSAGQFLKQLGLVKAGEEVENIRWELIGRFLQKYTQIGMLPNRAIDLFTCGLGAKSIYDYKYSELKRAIDNDATLTGEGRRKALEEAHKKAVMEADIFYNSTQQSSNPMFMSPMQVGRGAVDRAFSAYQNNNLGYVRKMLGHALDLVRSAQFEKMTAAYEHRYVTDGMNKDEAHEKARQQTLSVMGKSLLGLFVMGWLNKAAWDRGSTGFFGWLADPMEDEDKRKENETDEAYANRMRWNDALEYLGMAARPIQGTPLGNIVIDLSEMRGYNPLLAFDELNELAKDMQEVVKRHGVFSQQTLWMLTNRALRTGGINMETLGNMYYGIEQMMMDSFDGGDILEKEKLIDLMFILNTPNKGRATAARNLYKDASLEEYVAAVAKAEKYLKRGQSMAQWFPWMKYAEGDKFAREYKKLQKEWDAMHADVKGMDEKEFEAIIEQSEKKPSSRMSEANKLYTGYTNWDDIQEDSYIVRQSEVWKKAQKAHQALKKEDQDSEYFSDKADKFEERYGDALRLKKLYDEYVHNSNKWKLKLDGSDNDRATMETLRQLRRKFLRDMETVPVEE